MFKSLIILFLLAGSQVLAQNNTLDSLRNIITALENSADNLPIKVSWNWLPNYPEKYEVYYCSADDTTIMPVKDGVDGDLVSDWQTGSTVYNYFWVKQPLKRFLRIGIVGVMSDGQKTLMKCFTYDYN